MKPWLLGLAAALLLAAPVAAQPVAGHWFTPDMASRIDRLGDAEVTGERTPGIAIGVVEDGRLVYSRGFGYSNVARHIPVDASTQFSIGAVTAQFTTAAVLLLVQDGKLKLDDRITKYVPELTIAGNVTVAELLQQTSGLPDYTKAPGIDPDQTRQVKINDLLAAVNKMQLSTTPGTTYASNDFNFIVAGLIVERVSGVTLSDFLQQRIFLPLVMNQTLYAGDTGISPTHAVGYTRTAAGKFAPTRTPDPSWLLGARGVVSNVYDLAKWDIEMPILLRVDAVRDMYTPGGVAGPTQYGLGWVIDRRGGKRFMWYNGEIPGYRAINAVLPDDHIAVIVLTNTDSHGGGAVTAPAQVAARDSRHPRTAGLGTSRQRDRGTSQRVARTDRRQTHRSHGTYAGVQRLSHRRPRREIGFCRVREIANDRTDIQHDRNEWGYALRIRRAVSARPVSLQVRRLAGRQGRRAAARAVSLRASRRRRRSAGRWLPQLYRA